MHFVLWITTRQDPRQINSKKHWIEIFLNLSATMEIRVVKIGYPVLNGSAMADLKLFRTGPKKPVVIWARKLLPESGLDGLRATRS